MIFCDARNSLSLKLPSLRIFPEVKCSDTVPWKFLIRMNLNSKFARISNMTIKTSGHVCKCKRKSCLDGTFIVSVSSSSKLLLFKPILEVVGKKKYHLCTHARQVTWNHDIIYSSKELCESIECGVVARFSQHSLIAVAATTIWICRRKEHGLWRGTKEKTKFSTHAHARTVCCAFTPENENFYVSTTTSVKSVWYGKWKYIWNCRHRTNNNSLITDTRRRKGWWVTRSLLRQRKSI